MFKKLKNKIEMKILDVILARLLDAFKAKNPKLFAIVFLAIGYLNVWCAQTIEYWEKMAIVNPQYVEQVSGIEAYMPIIAQIGQYATIFALGLGGARTTQILAQANEQKEKGKS